MGHGKCVTSCEHCVVSLSLPLVRSEANSSFCSCDDIYSIVDCFNSIHISWLLYVVSISVSDFLPVLPSPLAKLLCVYTMLV